MPLILKAAGEKIYTRSGTGQARGNMEGIQNWTYMKSRAEVANSFTFEFPEPCFANGTRYVPGARDEILIYKSEADYDTDTRWFGGMLTDISDRTILSKEGGYTAQYTFQAQSFDIILDKELRQPILANMTWEAIIKLLVERHFEDQLDADVSNIVQPDAAPPVKINNGTMRDLLRAMRTLTGYDFTVDAYRKLHVFQAIDNPAPFELDDTVTGVTAFSSHPEVRAESRQVFNIVRQPFRQLIQTSEWDGESFTGKGDPKGSGGRLPLLRAPVEFEEATPLEEQFDGNAFSELWLETDTTDTQHPDFPNQGYLFAAEGQLQSVGGTGTLGGVALVSDGFYEYRPDFYIVMGFQLTNATGEGYIGLFTDGLGVSTGNFKAGLHVLDGALKALDGTTLVASLGVPTSYLLWIIQTADGWQYDIYGGEFATRQTIRTETSVTHLDDYVLAPIVNKSLECSMDFFRYQTNTRGVVLEIDGQKKTVGQETSFAGLPDIDAYLNTDESPAVLIFRAASAFTYINTVSDATHFSVSSGQGINFQTGHRLLIASTGNPSDALDGREAFVESVSGDNITLVSPGLSGMSGGQLILVNTTVPAKDAQVVVKYPYEREDEAVVRDQPSVTRFGAFPLTLPAKDYVRDFTSAQQHAQANLDRFKNGILKVNFRSNSELIDEPDSLMAMTVNLTRRPEPVSRTLTIQRVTITGHTAHHYDIEAESADPLKPLEEMLRNRSLIIGVDGSINFGISMTDDEVMDGEEIDIHEVADLFITLANPDGRRLGEFRLTP